MLFCVLEIKSSVPCCLTPYLSLAGGSPARVEAARHIVESGVAVMGHVGLTPQSVSVIGGFRPQAQVADEAIRVLEQAQALQKAGCFSVVLECIPAPIAAAVTSALSIPTIGIGAGPSCSGQASACCCTVS